MRHPNGFFGWVDLSTSDVEAARAFYSEFFGWESRDMPTPMGVDYTQFLLGGEVVCGMGPIPPDAAGMPSMWNNYVLVDDLAATLAAATGAGGTVVMPAMDIMTEGSMAMIADPSGAVLGLWQPKDHQGADVFNVPGSVTWNEVQTRDLESAKAFYATVFGWQWDEVPPGGGYWVCLLDSKEGDDKSNGGAMSMPPGVPEDMPSMWFTYFRVEQCDEAVSRAQGLGATIAYGPMEMGPGHGAGLFDPTGALFNVISFDA